MAEVIGLGPGRNWVLTTNDVAELWAACALLGTATAAALASRATASLANLMGTPR